jgi:hypothetical protein
MFMGRRVAAVAEKVERYQATSPLSRRLSTFMLVRLAVKGMLHLADTTVVAPPVPVTPTKALVAEPLTLELLPRLLTAWWLPVVVAEREVGLVALVVLEVLP